MYEENNGGLISNLKGWCFEKWHVQCTQIFQLVLGENENVFNFLKLKVIKNNIHSPFNFYLSSRFHGIEYP